MVTEQEERDESRDEDVVARVHASFALAGWLAAAAALAGVAALIVARDEAQAAVMAILVGAALAVLFLGAPFARAGRPSRLRLVLLYGLALPGMVLTFALGPLVAIGVVAVAYVIIAVALARWPPRDWQKIPPLKRIGRVPPGTATTTGGTLVALVAVTAAGFDVVHGRGPRFGVTALAGGATIACWLWLAFKYAGIGAARARSDRDDV
jgi:hypothetical protein